MKEDIFFDEEQRDNVEKKIRRNIFTKNENMEIA